MIADDGNEAQNPEPQAPAPDTSGDEPEQGSPAPDDFDVLFSEATEIYRQLWMYSRRRVAENAGVSADARTMVLRIEETLHSFGEDYAELRRLWQQDADSLSLPLRLKPGEAHFRNLADLQLDLLRALAMDDPTLRPHTEDSADIAKAVQLLAQAN